jgi:hypothetical protein
MAAKERIERIEWGCGWLLVNGVWRTGEGKSEARVDRVFLFVIFVFFCG